MPTPPARAWSCCGYFDSPQRVPNHCQRSMMPLPLRRRATVTRIRHRNPLSCLRYLHFSLLPHDHHPTTRPFSPILSPYKGSKPTAQRSKSSPYEHSAIFNAQNTIYIFRKDIWGPVRLNGGLTTNSKFPVISLAYTYVYRFDVLLFKY